MSTKCFLAKVSFDEKHTNPYKVLFFLPYIYYGCGWYIHHWITPTFEKFFLEIQHEYNNAWVFIKRKESQIYIPVPYDKKKGRREIQVIAFFIKITKQKAAQFPKFTVHTLKHLNMEIPNKWHNKGLINDLKNLLKYVDKWSFYVCSAMHFGNNQMYVTEDIIGNDRIRSFSWNVLHGKRLMVSVAVFWRMKRQTLLLGVHVIKVVILMQNPC